MWDNCLCFLFFRNDNLFCEVASSGSDDGDIHTLGPFCNIEGSRVPFGRQRQYRAPLQVVDLDALYLSWVLYALVRNSEQAGGLEIFDVRKVFGAAGFDHIGVGLLPEGLGFE